MGKNLPVVKYNFLTACLKPINFIKTKRRISCGNTKRNRRIFCCLEQKKNLLYQYTQNITAPQNWKLAFLFAGLAVFKR